MTLSLINLVFSAIRSTATQRTGPPSARCSRRQPGAQLRPTGGDRQLLWTKAFIDAARRPEDVAWVTGLLDGSTELEGEGRLRGALERADPALARIGVVRADEIGADRRDPTGEGRRAAAPAARPPAATQERRGARQAAATSLAGHEAGFCGRLPPRGPEDSSSRTSAFFDDLRRSGTHTTSTRPVRAGVRVEHRAGGCDQLVGEVLAGGLGAGVVR
jgi:hypothetical protein